MEVDVPSQREFDELKNRMEAVLLAFLTHLGLEEKQCEHPKLHYPPRERHWHRHECEDCKGTGIIFERKK